MIISESILINTSSRVIWKYLLDIKNRKDYIPALEEVIMLTPLPIRLGSQYIEVAEIGGRRLKTTYEIKELEPYKYAMAQTIDSIFPIKAETLLTDMNNGQTELRIDLDFKLKGIFKMASGIVGGIVRTQARGILKKVKGNIEMMDQ